MNDEDPCFTFPQEVIVIGCSRSGARGHRDGTDFDDTEVRSGERRAIRQQQQDSSPLLQTQAQERVADAIYVGSHLTVGANGFATSNRNLRHAAFSNMAVHKMIGKIEESHNLWEVFRRPVELAAFTRTQEAIRCLTAYWSISPLIAV